MYSIPSLEIYVVVDERKWDYGVYSDGPADEVLLYSQNKMDYEWWSKYMVVKVKEDNE